MALEGGHLRCARDKGDNSGRPGSHTCQAREGGLVSCQGSLWEGDRGVGAGRGGGGWMDEQYRCVPWQAWLRGQGLMDTDTDPDGADEGQNVTPSRRRSKGAVASPVVGSFTMGSSVARGATPWLLTWALPTVAVTLRMRWRRKRCLAICACTLPRTRRPSTAGMCGPPRRAGMPARPKGARGHD